MMKSLFRVMAIAMILACGIASAARLDPDLANRLTAADANQKLPVEFFMKAQAFAPNLDPNIPNLPKPQRRARVAQVLREFADASQHDVLSYLDSKATDGKAISISSLWLTNMVGCFATKDVIYDLVSRDDISDIVYGLVPIHLERPKLVSKPAPRDGVEPNLNVTQAPAAWRMGYTGQNVVVGEVDTGIWYTHQDLINHLWTSPNYPHPGFNYASHILFPTASTPSPNDTLDNIDYTIGHGTHCAGIVSADGTYGNGTHDTMGVAPSAKMLVCNSLCYFNSQPGETLLEQSMFLGFQFCISPPRDPTNGADVITTSLGLFTSNSPRYANYRVMERNIAAAGISHAIAAGNEGPTPQSIRTPGNCPPPWPNPANHPTDTATSACITVGATDNSDNAAGFTSIGPTTIWGTTPPYNDYAYPPGLMDPDVCAPGVDILSTFWQGDQAYTTMSGTSMATPATAGCIALMLSKNPSLTPRMVDSILEVCAVRDLGPSGKDVTYGAGRINCSLAVTYTPFPGPRHDLALANMLAPTTRVDPGAVIAPSVILANVGTYHETSIPVHFTIDSAGTLIYNQTFTVPGLDSAAVDTVIFPNWTVGLGRQTYLATAWHSYSPDTNRSNDTLHRSVMTKNHDVKAASCNLSGRVRTAQPVTPRLTLSDTGDYVEHSFNATCWIDSAGAHVYNQTVAVDSVMPGVPLQVAFPDWTPGPESTVYDVTMFHSLGADQNRANDTLHRVVVSSNSVMRVAIELAASSPGRTPPNAIYRIDSLCRAVGWEDSIVVGSDIGTVDELNDFTVVVSGSDGHYQQTDFGSYQDALLDWVRGGGGFVGCGWIVYGICGELGTSSKMDTVLAVRTTGNYTFVQSGNVTITDSTHPITSGVADFPVQQYGEYAPAGLWPDAVQLATYTGSEGSVVCKPLGSGRSVYLGPIYYGDFNNYLNEPYYDDVNAMLLLKQAIEWAGMGSVSSVKGPATAPAQLRFALNSVRPNPMSNSATISYSLAGPSLVKLSVFNLVGQEVGTVTSANQAAGQYSATWRGLDRTGTKVPSGVYFVRLRAGSNTATRKLIVE